MKSILHIGKFYPPFNGGIENFMAELLPLNNGSGYRVSALVHQHKVTTATDCEMIRGVKIYRAACFGSLMFAPFSPWFLKDINYCLKLESPDILHIHMPNTSAFWLFLSAEVRKLPWVIHWHSDVLGDKPKWFIKMLYPVYRIFEKAMLKRAKRIICTSPSYCDSSEPLAKFRSKVTIIPLGLPLPNSNSIQVSEKGKLRILVVGRLSYYKGHKVLFDAIASMPKSYQSRIEVKVVGRGELNQELNNHLKQNGIDCVEMLGGVSEQQLNDCYTWCDLLCLPSIERTEAFGLVILEAARKAKPALVTDVKGSGMGWVVQNEKTGWVVPSKSASAIAEKLIELSTTPEVCRHYGQAALKRFESNFSIENVAQQTLDLYESIEIDKRG